MYFPICSINTYTFPCITPAWSGGETGRDRRGMLSVSTRNRIDTGKVGRSELRGNSPVKMDRILFSAALVLRKK